MTTIDYVVVGQGVCGSFVAWNLEKANQSFIMIDKPDPLSSSRVAAGIINPVTGRRIVQTWMIDTLLDHAGKAYAQLGEALDVEAMTQKNSVSFFPSPQMLQAFIGRLEEDAAYLSFPADQEKYRNQFRYDFGYGEISPCYAVNLAELLPALRARIKNNNRLIEETFDHSLLQLTDEGITYKDIRAKKIIFCDGAGAMHNPWFRNLPFACNKGEALIIKSDHLPTDKVFKKSLSLAPLAGNLFWAGSSYEWDFQDDKPSAIFRQKTEKHLREWIKSPFEITDHLASLRPATVERKPFVGIHPHHPQIAILNGMGAKGCSLAPYFADQLVDHLVKNAPIMEEADVSRFRRILGKDARTM
ncbi:MAG: FAD-binding oxidoreductase [Chitinophagaceae bacterium]|nr:FAD-binding oxidoreductase [Chitinophagaceae bacterium]